MNPTTLALRLLCSTGPEPSGPSASIHTAPPVLIHRPPALLLAALLPLAACATYPQKTAKALTSFEAGRFDAALADYSDPDTTGSDFLRRAEAGMVALTAGEWERAQSELQAAAGTVQDIEERALVGPEKLGEGLLAFTLNEGLAAYQGEGYERVQLHAALAMTYLAQGDLDGVWVEARRANQLLEGEERLYEKRYAAGGLGHLVSALSYELLEQYDQAYIDYERMLEKGVGEELAGRAVVRIASQLRYDDELERWVERFGPDAERPEGAAQVVVIAGVGLGPFKRETTLPIPTGDGVLQWSIPRLQRRGQLVQGLVLRSGEGAVQTTVVEDVAKVSEENLSDRIGWLAARSAVRAIMKRELTQGLAKNYDLAGMIAGDIFTVLTERADLRAWQTLPDSWHAARLWVAPGEHDLTLEALGGQTVSLGRFSLDRGETMVVLARTLAGRVYAHPIGGLRILAEARAAEAAAAKAAEESEAAEESKDQGEEETLPADATPVPD